MEGPEAWEQHQGETGRTFALFVAYRDLGPGERSLSRVAREFGRTLGSVEQVSRRHNWVARCYAWDAENERIKRASQIGEREAMARRQVYTGQLFQSRGVKRIQALMDKEAEDLTISEAIRLVVTGVRLERLGRGEPAGPWQPYVEPNTVASDADPPLMEILRRNPSAVGPVVEALSRIQELLPELDGTAGWMGADVHEADDAELASFFADDEVEPTHGA